MRVEEETVPWEVLGRAVVELRAELGARFLATAVVSFDDFADAVFCRAERIAPGSLPPSSLYDLAIALLTVAPVSTSAEAADPPGGRIPAVWPALRRAWIEINEEMLGPARSIDLAIVYGCSHEVDQAAKDSGRPWPGAVDALSLMVVHVVRRRQQAGDAEAAAVARHFVSHIVHGSCVPPGNGPGVLPAARRPRPRWCARPVTLEGWYPSLAALLASLFDGEPSDHRAPHVPRAIVARTPVPEPGPWPSCAVTDPTPVAPEPPALVPFEALDWQLLRRAVTNALLQARVIRSSCPGSHLNSLLLPLLSDGCFANVVRELARTIAGEQGAVGPASWRLAVAFAATVVSDADDPPAATATAWEDVQRLLDETSSRLRARSRDAGGNSQGLVVSEAELVVAYGAGWRGPGRPLDLDQARPGATSAVLALINMITTETYEAIVDRWGVEEQTAGRWDASGRRSERYAGDAQLILERLTNRCYCDHHRRDCPWGKARSAGGKAPAARCHCCRPEHRLSSWDPAKDSLWSYLRTAVRGPERKGSKVLPSLRVPPPTGAFRSSMLAYLLEEAGLIRFVTSEAWSCACGDRFPFEGLSCGRCEWRAGPPEMVRVQQPDWLIVRRDEGRYQEVLRRACGRCGHLADWPATREQRQAQRCPRCGSDRLSQRSTHVWSRSPGAGWGR